MQRARRRAHAAGRCPPDALRPPGACTHSPERRAERLQGQRTAGPPVRQTKSPQLAHRREGIGQLSTCAQAEGPAAPRVPLGLVPVRPLSHPQRAAPAGEQSPTPHPCHAAAHACAHPPQGRGLKVQGGRCPALQEGSLLSAGPSPLAPDNFRRLHLTCGHAAHRPNTPERVLDAERPGPPRGEEPAALHTDPPEPGAVRHAGVPSRPSAPPHPPRRPRAPPPSASTGAPAAPTLQSSSRVSRAVSPGRTTVRADRSLGRQHQDGAKRSWAQMSPSGLCCRTPGSSASFSACSEKPGQQSSHGWGPATSAPGGTVTARPRRGAHVKGAGGRDGPRGPWERRRGGED